MTIIDQGNGAAGPAGADLIKDTTTQSFVKDVIEESKRNDAAVKAVQAAIDLAEQAESVGPAGELEQKVAANPLDHQARFDLATALNAQGNRAAATEQLLAIVKRDRKWNDDGARKQLVQFFEAWGPTDEATVNGRKRLSSILFS